MQDKFIEEIKGLNEGELIELYNKICDHINYLSSSIIEVVENDNTEDIEDEDEDEEKEDDEDIEEDIEEGGEDDGNE